MLTVLSLILVILGVMIMISFLMKSNHHNSVREKLSPFECGFDPDHKMRMSFSLRFFVITVVFLVFDVEIALLFPNPMGYSSLLYTLNLYSNIVIFMILAGGLIFEWLQGALEWH